MDSCKKPQDPASGIAVTNDGSMSYKYIQGDACSRQMSTSTSAVDSDAPNLKVRRFSSLKAATNNFSSEDKEREVPSYCIAYNKDKDKVMCE
ncbi:hypothetical protein ACFX14_025847 [Malus domestica]